MKNRGFSRTLRTILLSSSLLFMSCVCCSSVNETTVEILNVSYDPTRDLFVDINSHFSEYWEGKTGQSVRILQSHGGSGKQARSVIDGLRADVVTLALAHDIEAISRNGFIYNNWQNRLKHNSTPFHSTIVFIVRKGNPAAIMDWDDLARPDVSVVTPNPKISGGARWNYLGALGYAIENEKTEAETEIFLEKIFRNVPVLDAGARGSLTTFIQRGIGDVLISWESEAYLALQLFGNDLLEIVYPSVSVLAEPAVSVVDKVVQRKGTEDIATAYLEFLYSEKGQKTGAEHFFRPSDENLLLQYSANFPDILMLSIEELGGWDLIQKKHFADGGLFDRIFSRRRGRG
ncbi:Sulfate and thiosulfate binding protein CysP [Chitinispirillum alkaliphilum]|nr:Sulfate and thiosulfate binding protein CysP [Chitinispirillum alkaliphilum]